MPEPIKCYYLLENTERQEHVNAIVLDETEQVSFFFSRATDTPPSTPMISQPRGSSNVVEQGALSSDEDMPMFGGVPDLNVIKPTPTTTPRPTPPNSAANSDSDEPTPPETKTPPYGSPYNSDLSSEATDSTQTSPCPFFGTTTTTTHPTSPEEIDFHQGTGSPPDHFQAPPYIAAMRTSSASMRTSSMSPLKEDLNEEENGFSSAVNADEGIFVRKISDVSNSSVGSNNGGAAEASSTTKLPSRKISDVSDHSGESGIESTTSKVSDTSKDSLPSDREAFKQSLTSVERKLSDSSTGSAEDELSYIRLRRAGSVSKTVEKYDSLHRCRKSGLPTVVLTMPSSDDPEGEPSNWNSMQQNCSSLSTTSI